MALIQDCEAAEDASIISGPSPRQVGARTREGMSCFGDLSPQGSTDRQALVQRRQAKWDRSSSASCEVWLSGRVPA